MSTSVFRFEFARGVKFPEVEATLLMAVLAAEGVFGESRVRMDVTYFADAPRMAILVDGTLPAGDAVVRIFIGFLVREIGADGFTVRRVPAARGAAGKGVAA